MALFAKKKPPGPAADEQKISLALTPDEIDLLRECMKRTEDYYRGLLLLKQDWNAAQNEAAIAMIKVRLNMIDKLQEKASPRITAICNKKTARRNAKFLRAVCYYQRLTDCAILW
mgnify:CR=1 FL=1